MTMRINIYEKPTDEELDNRFRYHAPCNGQRGKWKIAAHEQVTESTLELAKQLRNICPAGRNLSLVLTQLEDVRMRANAAIACDWDDETDQEWSSLTATHLDQHDAYHAAHLKAKKP